MGSQKERNGEITGFKGKSGGGNGFLGFQKKIKGFQKKRVERGNGVSKRKGRNASSLTFTRKGEGKNGFSTER